MNKQEQFPPENEITIDTTKLNPRIFNRLYNVEDAWLRALLARHPGKPYVDSDRKEIVYIFRAKEEYTIAFTEKELERFPFVDLTSLDSKPCPKPFTSYNHAFTITENDYKRE